MGRTAGTFIVGLGLVGPALFPARILPLLDQKCAACHRAEKHKGDLRLDSFAHLMAGGEDGPVVLPKDPAGSELLRRVTLPTDDDEFMPSGGKPPLTADEIELFRLWIGRGASVAEPAADFGALGLAPAAPAPVIPSAPDYRPRLGQIKAFETTWGVRLVPRSQVPTDGLVLRTASSPGRCSDQVLRALAPLADLIVEAELARTPVSDAGLASVASWSNLRKADLSHTAITSAGAVCLAGLAHLESLNLTATAVDDAGAARLRAAPGLRKLYLFDTRAAP